MSLGEEDLLDWPQDREHTILTKVQILKNFYNILVKIIQPSRALK